jgi:hypothetical protein
MGSQAEDLDVIDVVLVAGELAANAVCQTRRAFRISLSLLDDVVTMEATDASAAMPLFRTASATVTSGRGV